VLTQLPERMTLDPATAIARLRALAHRTETREA
jgi:hypothetical protein